jgi:hypothetical protein
MELGSLNQFIKKALEYYDNKILEYVDFIKLQDVKYKLDTNEITFTIQDKKPYYFSFETLGYFDNTEHIWIWSWLLQELKSDQTKIARDLLNYGLKLEPETLSTDHHFFKALLVNSRVSIDEMVQLDINIAIFGYLMKDKFKFIYPRKVYLDDTKSKFITFYLLIK